VLISLPMKLLKTIIFSLMPHLSPRKMDSSYILSETGEDGKGPDVESKGPDEESKGPDEDTKGPDEETTQEPDEETEPEPEENQAVQF
jgi:hypothetical protein